jgi:hypothetical protein
VLFLFVPCRLLLVILRSRVKTKGDPVVVVILSLRCCLGLELTTPAGHSGAIGIVVVSWRHLHRGMGEEKMRRRGRV